MSLLFPQPSEYVPFADATTHALEKDTGKATVSFWLEGDEYVPHCSSQWGVGENVGYNKNVVLPITYTHEYKILATSEDRYVSGLRYAAGLKNSLGEIHLSQNMSSGNVYWFTIGY